ncbi:MAG: hypothetical protein WAN12_04835 [Candidatus Acidiferrum sp.]
MKRLLWLATLACAAALAACGGGGGSTIPPPPPAGGFTLSSLKGQYAFSMSGSDQSGAYFARTGSFVADGAGNISSAIEDVVDLGAGITAEVTFVPGNYSVQANGRGIIALKDTSGDLPLMLTMDLQSPGQGFLVETDGNAATSGSFNLQTIADFLPNSFNGNYIFDFSGADSSGANTSIIGNISANGSGLSITAGLIDTNDSTNGPVGPTPLTLPGTFALDATYGATFGRGTAAFAGHTYAFYIVDTTQIMFLQEDSQGGSSGDAFLQSGAIPTNNTGFTGSFAYLVGGASLSTFGPDAAVARFTPNGAGGIGTISYDENNSGTPLHISQGSNISNATYAIDTTNAGSGRGTFTFTDSSSARTFQYVFYLISPTSGVIQDVSTGIVADGTLLAQTGAPFTLAGLAGNYAFNWSGASASAVENYVGQYALANTATNNISGVVDATSLDVNGVASFPNSGLQGTLTITSDGSANNTYQISAGNSVASTYGFQAYIVDANTVLLLSTDKTRVLAGFVSRQSQ